MSARVPKLPKDTGPSALFLIEEAMQLLRGAQAADLCWYYVGGVPWVLGLLLFWSYATWFAPTGAELAWGALLLVVLFGWLKFCQAVFAERLLARRREVPLPVVHWPKIPRLIFAEIRRHAVGLFALPVASVLAAPMGYVWTYYQQLSVTRAEDGKRDDAWDLAKLWPMQTHLGMAILGVLIFIAWLNLFGAFLLVPYLLNRFFGFESVLGLNDWVVMNTSFLAATAASAWLAVDPLLKAYHVVRCFHGRALADGEDLREAFLDTKGRRLLLLLALLAGLGLGGGAQELKAHAPASVLPPTTEQPTRAAEPFLNPKVFNEPLRSAPSTTPQRVAPKDLKQAIEQTLHDSDFAWRLKAKPVLEKDKTEGPISRFFKVGVATLKELIDSLQRRYQKIKRWWKQLTGGGDGEEEETANGKSGKRSEMLFNLFTYVLGGLLLLALGYLCYVVARQAKRNARRHVLAVPNYSPLIKPDLSDETVHAAQLPSSGWLELAREKLAAGEWRLAFRALYLAQLATFAEQGFLRLARHKTNQDYETELRRRQPQRSELLDTFGRRRRDFDAVWYGHGEAGEHEIRNWLTELERKGTP